jgi:Leucine-rich repeat (LRR) protein
MEMEESWFKWFSVDLVLALRQAAREESMLDRQKFLDSIEILDLSGLSQAAIPDYVKDMTNLKMINLSDNRISGAVNGNSFPSGIERIDLSKNEITSFSFEGFSAAALKGLGEVILSFNQLEQFPDKANLCLGLKTLYLGSNKIKEISKSVKIPMDLTSLMLDHNEIEKVEVGRSGLTRCVELDLSYNQLSSIPENLLKGKLKYLNLSGNDIQEWGFLPVAGKRGITVK